MSKKDEKTKTAARGKKPGGDIHARIPPDLHARLAASAEVNRRSVNRELVVILEKALPA